MSDSAAEGKRPDVEALKELEKLVHVLGGEMAGWRRRAQLAEARLKDKGIEPPNAGAGRTGRDADLARENAELKRRLAAAKDRTQQLLDRVRFLRQQHEMELER